MDEGNKEGQPSDPVVQTTAEHVQLERGKKRKLPKSSSREALVGIGLAHPALTTNTKIGVIQLTSVDSVEDNFSNVLHFVQQARRENVEMVFLPECFSFIGSPAKPSITVAEPLDGPIMRRYQAMAAEHKMWMSLGGFQEKVAGVPNKLYNTHIILDDRGRVKGTYRKIHLFDAPVVGLKESAFTEPGTHLTIVDSPAGKLGLGICYDLRFPQMFNTLRKLGAEILLVPSAFTFKTGSAHWESLLKARAIENQCYVIAAAQCGRHHAARESWGRSLVADPWGVAVAQAGHAPGLLLAHLDRSYIQEVRSQMPITDHARPQSYQLLQELPTSTEKYTDNCSTHGTNKCTENSKVVVTKEGDDTSAAVVCSS